MMHTSWVKSKKLTQIGNLEKKTYVSGKLDGLIDFFSSPHSNKDNFR